MLSKGEGPIGLILAPTRELAEQIYKETKYYASPFNLSVLSFFGNIKKEKQWKMMRDGMEIVISTPGRLIQLIKKKGIKLDSRCSYVVLDEADTMFSMGFEYQIRTILSQIRPDRQILLFSATFKEKIQKLCADILKDPLKIVIGKMGVANEDVFQQVVLFHNEDSKLEWLVQNMTTFLGEGQVLIFCNQIALVEQLHPQLHLQYPKQGILGYTQ